MIHYENNNKTILKQITSEKSRVRYQILYYSIGLLTKYTKFTLKTIILRLLIIDIIFKNEKK